MTVSVGLSPGHFAHGNVRWRPAPTAPGAATMGQSASAAVLGTRPQTASAAVSTSGAAADLGGAVGNAIAAELEERAAIAHTEKLLEENERLRCEVSFLQRRLRWKREEEEGWEALRKEGACWNRHPGRRGAAFPTPILKGQICRYCYPFLIFFTEEWMPVIRGPVRREK